MCRSIAVVLLLVFVLPVAAAGGISACDSTVTVSRDGTRLLVMVSYVRDLDRGAMATLPDGRTVNVYDQFKKSGAYDARTLEPIWQVDWYEQERRLRWSPDFRHVVRKNIWGMRKGWGLIFYENGRAIQQYDCGELLTGLCSIWFVPFETWDWHDRWYDDFELDGDGVVRLSTARRRFYIAGWKLDLGLQEFYTFDLATGAMRSRRVTGWWRVPMYVVVLLSAVIALRTALQRLWRAVRERTLWRRRRGFEVACAAAPSEASRSEAGRSGVAIT